MSILIRHNYYLTPNWPAPPHVKAYTTLRPSPLGRFILNTENSPEARRVPRWRAKTAALAASIPVPPLAAPVWLQQTHSARVVHALAENSGATADASCTTPKNNNPCVVITADCLPILLCSRSGAQVAAIHAGWRGLARGVIEATLKLMELPPPQLLVWLGPAIGPQKFIVGPDVYAIFTAKDRQFNSAFVPIAGEDAQWHCDLYCLARFILGQHGIMARQIYGGTWCTYTQKELFFSYRREGARTGRMASIIWHTANG